MVEHQIQTPLPSSLSPYKFDNFATLQITPSSSKFLLSKLQNHTFEMTKSNTSSESSKSFVKTARISVKPCCFNKTVKSSSSSSTDASLNISSPTQDFLNLTTSTPSSTPCNTNVITIQDLLNLATPTPSPPHCNTNIATIPPPNRPSGDSTSPSQQAQPSKTPSPQSPTLTPMELFHTPPTSPLPYLDNFDDLSPKSSSPPSLSLFDTIAQMETQQQPSEQLDDEPHQPSLVERMAYRYARPSIFPNDQGHTHLQSFIFHPIYKDLHGNPSGEPSFRHFVQQQEQPQQQQPPQQ
jgi:hypothetical protein